VNKYIFITGAPGSAWSRVALSIYKSTSLDNSDYSSDRTFTYVNDEKQIEKSFHHGVYFGPDQQFGKRFDKLYEMTKDEIELEMNLPFNSSGIKVIKCHDFSYQLDFLSETWPECPIIMCHRPMEISYDWWMHIGGPNITYPSYKSIDPKKYINLCNDGIYDFIKKNKTIEVKNNMELCEVLEIDPVNDIYYYDNSDGKNVITNVNVKV